MRRAVIAATVAAIASACGRSETSKEKPDYRYYKPDTELSSKQMIVTGKTELRIIRIPKIVILGDSILSWNDSYVSQKIYEKISEKNDESIVTNSARQGQLVRDWIGEQFDKYVIDRNYNTIVLQGGVNDIMWWIMQSRPAAREHEFQKLIKIFETMVEDAGINEKALVLVTVSPWKNKGQWNGQAQEFTERLNSWMREQRGKKHVYLADSYSALVQPGDQFMKPEYQGKDAQHPNEKGSAVIAKVISKALEDIE
ncbi:SGNH/GDSL hydrolase family protein [Candidatus Micrarchaeota archaeon]|nr:SGNH/GDSL hydrolase family protein [Candidatus Micrarchaeota archaeon]